MGLATVMRVFGIVAAGMFVLALLLMASRCAAADLVIADDATLTTREAGGNFQWFMRRQQINLANSGENTAGTFRMDKRGEGNSWALVAESHCIHPRKGCHGLEVDLVLNGPVQWGDWRLGQSIVFWGAGQAHDALLIADGMRQGAVTVQHGVRIDIACEVACIQLRREERVCWGQACLSGADVEKLLALIRE